MSLGKLSNFLKVTQLVSDEDGIQTLGLAASKALLVANMLYLFPTRMLTLLCLITTNIRVTQKIKENLLLRS